MPLNANASPALPVCSGVQTTDQLSHPVHIARSCWANSVWPRDVKLLQAGLEGEPTWKTPRVPPAQSPGITLLAQEADSQTSTTKAAPASPDALQLDAFVDKYVESIVSKAKSELVAEALHSTPLKGDAMIKGGAPVTPGSLAFTQGSSAGSTASPHKSRPSRAQPHPLHMPLSQHAVSPNKQQQQQGPVAAVSACTQAARGSELLAAPDGRGSSRKDAQQEGQLDDVLSPRVQAPAVSEGHASSKDTRINGSDGQGGWQLTGEGVVEIASAGEQSGKDGLVAPQPADADTTRMVSEIVQEILQAVSERTHADQVSNVALTRGCTIKVCSKHV